MTKRNFTISIDDNFHAKVITLAKKKRINVEKILLSGYNTIMFESDHGMSYDDKIQSLANKLIELNKKVLKFDQKKDTLIKNN